MSLVSAGDASAQTSAEPEKVPVQGAQVSPAPTDNGPSVGDVQEVQQMLERNALETLRSTSNGDYDARLLIDRRTGTYYSALIQQGAVWRVVKAQDEARTGSIYRSFVRQTEQLSAAEMRRTQLEAQKAQTEQRLALVEERENRLRADLNTAREQAALAENRNQETRAQMMELRAQRDAAQTKLMQARTQVGQLQRQVYGGLPSEHHTHGRKRRAYHQS
ncbi:DUF2968 domain-containing protein [Burkholderia ubonensis]|uniref:DUF2968 domain-containing protein n=1 Tax=Burkholderia ubonensis TaxID=101571 RepID=UPI0022B76070|nr:DUF2968 domain-containing protein [Burkholderia ubonensis]